MNYYEWLAQTTKEFNTAPAELRRGQFLMIKLHEQDPRLYEAVSHTKLDCFYDDKKVDEFLVFIYNNWKMPDESK